MDLYEDAGDPGATHVVFCIVEHVAENCDDAQQDLSGDDAGDTIAALRQETTWDVPAPKFTAEKMTGLRPLPGTE